jgi:hypothetical protein
MEMCSHALMDPECACPPSRPRGASDGLSERASGSPNEIFTCGPLRCSSVRMSRRKRLIFHVGHEWRFWGRSRPCGTAMRPESGLGLSVSRVGCPEAHANPFTNLDNGASSALKLYSPMPTFLIKGSETHPAAIAVSTQVALGRMRPSGRIPPRHY